MTFQERKQAFIALGEFLKGYIHREAIENSQKDIYSQWDAGIEKASKSNPWFTHGFILQSFNAISEMLDAAAMERWLGNYTVNDNDHGKTVAVIMAGNIPLVGFHDFLSVLLSGHKILARMSSDDQHLFPLIKNFLLSYHPDFDKLIEFQEGTVNGFNAIIATGSDNSSRYFEHYFASYPNIIRKNKTSIAILSGNESCEELKALGSDVFSYFGLGCRSVTALFLPENNDLSKLNEAFNKYSYLMDHAGYRNNYDYNKAIFMVNREEFFDTGFLLMRPSRDIHSPIACLHLVYYSSEEELQHYYALYASRLQCCIGGKGVATGALAFGCSQSPAPDDYADGIDTMQFLLAL